MKDSETARLAELTERFREFHRLSLARYDSYSSLYADYLRTGMRLLDLPVGIVSRIENSTYTILAVEPDTLGVATGDTLQLGQTYCSEVFTRDQVLAVAHAGEDHVFSGHPAYLEMRLQTYIAAPICVDGEIYGTLNFTAPEARREPFDETDTELVELMAARIGQVIEQDHADREKREALFRLRENIELFESAFASAAIGMALVSLEGRWLRVNRAVTEIFGYSEAELLAIDFQTVTHPDDLDADLVYLGELLAGERETYRMQKRYFDKSGRQIWALLSVSVVHDQVGQPEYFISQIQDITAQKNAEAQVQQRQIELESANAQLKILSTTDPLTELGNRRELDRRMREELARGMRSGEALSLLIMDVDHFKRFNDTHGHLEGDVVLRKLAGALRRVARVNDSLIRQGGEEFVILLPHTDEAGCHTVAARVHREVAKLDGLAESVSVSTGGATWVPTMAGHEAPQAEELLKRADEALYLAKAEGRDCHRQAKNLYL